MININIPNYNFLIFLYLFLFTIAFIILFPFYWMVISSVKTLDEYLLVKYIDGNIKRQNEDGSFKNNGHVKHVPPAPIFGGYSDTYKKAVAKEQK